MSGKARIAHLAGPVEYGPAMHPDTNWEDDVALRRLQAYRTWMESRSIGDPELIGYCGDWVPKHIPVILDRWMTLPQPPTAVFCANDALALALMTEALQRGLRVPEDLSLVGVDNSTEAYDAVVPLTTIEVPVEAIGREAVRVLLNLLHGAPLEECQSVVAGSMIVLQESTGPVAAAGPSK